MGGRESEGAVQQPMPKLHDVISLANAVSWGMAWHNCAECTLSTSKIMGEWACESVTS